MRILFISAFYPPYIIGGWEQLVQEVNSHLLDRGHDTYVLTSNYGVDKSEKTEDGIERLLTLEGDLNHYRPLSFFIGRRIRIQNNLQITRKVIQRYKPDIVFIHVLWNLSKRIAYIAEQLCPGRVVYYIANDWPYAIDVHEQYWNEPARPGFRRKVKSALSEIALRQIEREKKDCRLNFDHVLCVSKAVQNKLLSNLGLSINRTKVVYNGIDTDLFNPSPVGRIYNSNGLKIVYVGSLVPHKGVHTIIEAMDLIINKSGLYHITLSIIGGGNLEYETKLRKMVRTENLEKYVHFLGRVPREKLPSILKNYDIFVFPSIWEEPLARAMQEAMASGLVVVGTLTGGTGELLVEGETGLTFIPGDSLDLSRKLMLLYQSRMLWEQLRLNARQIVVERFDIHRMIDEIESYFNLLS